ncbi:hypothetical protein AAHB54_11235, partial [Bacillus cereus]
KKKKNLFGSVIMEAGCLTFREQTRSYVFRIYREATRFLDIRCLTFRNKPSYVFHIYRETNNVFIIANIF